MPLHFVILIISHYLLLLIEKPAVRFGYFVERKIVALGQKDLQ
jgi:hypothetical protein